MFFLPKVVLQDGDLCVRLLRMSDVRLLERALLDNRRWLEPWEASDPRGKVKRSTKELARLLLLQAKAGDAVPFVMEYRGQIIGQITLSNVVHGSLSEASLGYWIAQAHSSRGFTSTAVALVVDYCFHEMGLHRVEVCVRPENAPSLKVVEKVGFRYEGLRQKYIFIDGAWRDHLCFVLLMEDVPEGALTRLQRAKLFQHKS